MQHRTNEIASITEMWSVPRRRSPEVCFASGVAARYPAAMKTVINMDENIGKTVGRRTALRDGFSYGMGMQRLCNQLSKSFQSRGLCMKGVFRFKTHEEADEWMLKMLARRRKTKS